VTCGDVMARLPELAVGDRGDWPRDPSAPARPGAAPREQLL